MTSANGEKSHALAAGARQFAAILGASIAALARAPRIRLPAMAFVAERQRIRVGVVVTAFAAIVSMIWFDAAAIRAVAGLPGAINETYNVITDFGRSGWFLWPSGVLVLAAAAARARTVSRMAQLVLASIAVRSGYVFLAVAIPGLLDTIGKRWIGRVRPSEFGPFAYYPLSWNEFYASLPSGHTAAAFSALVAVGSIFPRLRPLLWIYAVTIAMSRVIVSAHYPSDAIAGAAVGAFGAVLVREWFAARRLGFYAGSDGKVHAMPGPSLRRIKKVIRGLVAQ
jgi:undecaprenyl-diphosphatase